MSRNWKLTALQGDTEITTLLTEGAATRENLCLQSEDIDTTWSSVGTIVTDVNSTAAPDGSQTADKFTDNNVGGVGGRAISQAITVSTSQAYTCSVYLKADQLTWGYMSFESNGTLAISAYFDLSNGVVGATLGANNDDQGIEAVGNGWYRCWISFTSDSVDTTGNLRVYLADSDGDTTIALDGTSSIFVWGAQFEAGASATAYIPTTTVARTIAGRATTNALQDDVHIALETVLEVTNQSTDDLWKRYKRLT